MTTLKDLTDKQAEDLKSKVESYAESNPEKGTKFSCGEGKARWDSRQMSQWKEYGHNRLYFRNAEDAYIDLQKGKVVGNDHNKVILKVAGYTVVAISENTGETPSGIEYFPTAIVPKNGVDQ